MHIYCNNKNKQFVQEVCEENLQIATLTIKFKIE